MPCGPIARAALSTHQGLGMKMRGEGVRPVCPLLPHRAEGGAQVSGDRTLAHFAR